MWKNLIAMTIALIITASFSITAFAGNTEGAGDITAPTSTSAAKNSITIKESSQAESVKTKSEAVSKQESADVDDKSKKSTYDDFNDLEKTGPDAEFYAAIKKVLEEGKPVNNEVKIVEITKPDKIDDIVSIYKRNFSISVMTKFDDVIYSVAKLNSDSGKYERIEFDEEKSIKLTSGTDTKEILLEYGITNFLLIAYRDSEKIESKVQYTVIAVKASKETVGDKAITPAKTVWTSGSEPSGFDLFLNSVGKGK
jgi:hypothetical protein